jgi:hypothetical protein
MSNFWKSGTGNEIKGTAELAFMADFSIIPEGTTAIASIKSFEVIETTNEYTGPQKFMQIMYKITSGDYKGREVKQKIKCFDGKPEAIDRNLNMLKLVMDLCGYKPTHHNEPTNQELMAMNDKVVGIKIREWSVPKQDGSGMMEGNFVAEVHSPVNFVTETGTKIKHVESMPTDSALSRNAGTRSGIEPSMDDDLPF